jgi:hypothetical protein
MAKRYSTYPAAPAVLVAGTSFAAQLPNIVDVRLCRDNSVVIEVAVIDNFPVTQETLQGLSGFFLVSPDDICVLPGDEDDRLFIEVWSTCFDFSEFFPADTEERDLSEDEFSSEHEINVDGEIFHALATYDYGTDTYEIDVPGIPGGDVFTYATQLEDALDNAGEEIENRLQAEALRQEEESASLFESGGQAFFEDEFPDHDPETCNLCKDDLH